MKRRRLASFALIISLGSASAQAELWQDVFRGLDFLVTPSGSPLLSAGDGTRTNGARSGRLRIVPNGVVGRGYRLELDRTFGADSRGRPEIFRFGALGDLTLEGPIQATAGYTKTGDLRLGSLEFTANNLGYRLASKVGVQDAELTGQISVANRLEINSLGFYDLTLAVSNTQSQLRLDGVLVHHAAPPTNFDIGPIVIQGNIFADLTAGLLNALGAESTGLEQLFPDSPIGLINDAVTEELQGTRAGATAKNNMAPLLLQSVFQGNEAAANALLEGLVAGTLSGNGESGQAARVMVPEPGTLVLAVLGGSIVWYWRRRGSQGAQQRTRWRG